MLLLLLSSLLWLLVLLSGIECMCNPSDLIIDLSNSGITSINGTMFKDWNCNPHAATLDLSGNKIKEIGPYAFAIYDASLAQKYYPSFTSLQNLILDDNEISFVNGSAFKYINQRLNTLSIKNNKLISLQSGLLDDIGNTLVNLYIQNNSVAFVEDSVFTNKLYFLKNVDMSYNKMTYMEPWPYIVPRIISFNLTYNQINKFTNELKWIDDLSEPYHTHVDLRYNNFSVWDDEWFRQYERPGSEFVFDFFTYRIDVTNNPWICDCHIHYFAKRIQSTFIKYASANEFSCYYPSNLRGYLLSRVNLDKLVCDVQMDCPIGCTCTNISSTNTLLVDCKDGNLTALPSQLPDIPGRYIKLMVSNNKIRQISSIPYAKKLSELVADNNRLVYVSHDAVLNMTSPNMVLNISNNQLQYLPTSIRNIKNSSFHNNQYRCTCNMTWMAKWLGMNTIAADDKIVTCTDEVDRVHKIADVTESLLDCSYTTEIALAIGFGVLLVLVIIGVVWAKRCPYETKVLIFKFIGCHPSDKYKVDKEKKKIDVYIAFDDENIYLRQWVIKMLKRRLEQKKIKVFIPITDLVFGDDRGDQMVAAMEESKRVIIILSKDYDKNDWCVFECQQAELLTPNEGRVIFIKYHPEADAMVKDEPWKSRIKDRRVFSIGDTSSEQRWFWDKLIYEMPIK